jgi:hypothetical protein
MEHLYEEETEDEKEVEGEYEEDLTKSKEQVQQVPPKTPSKQVQKNHPSDQIIRNKYVGVETVGKLRGGVNQLSLCLNNYIHF